MMSEIDELKDIPESEFPMNESQERIVRSLGNVRLAVEAKYPEIQEVKLTTSVLLPYKKSSWVHVIVGYDFIEARLSDDTEDPIGSGIYLGRVDYSFRPANKPYVESGVEYSAEQAEAIVGQALQRAKEAKRL